MLKIFVGVDRYEMVAFHVAAHSIMRHSKIPVSITPLYKHNLREILWRERDPLQSTDFAFSRFLVPYLSDYEGLSVFMDCDVLVKCCVSDFYRIRDSDPYSAVWCVKHDYEPAGMTKFLGQEQTKYPMKNWSSVMMFNNNMCRLLTPDYVNTRPGLDLHQLKWVDHDNLIGEIPREYNWLVGEYHHNDQAKILHYTQGTPCFNNYNLCDHADEWHQEREKMNGCVQKIHREKSDAI